ESCRHRQQIDQSGKHQTATKTDAAAPESQYESFAEELPLNVSMCRAQRLAYADFLRSFAHGDEHDVHHADSSKGKSDHADRNEEFVHAFDDVVHHHGLQRSVPDRQCFLILMVEIVTLADDVSNFILERTSLEEIDLSLRRKLLHHFVRYAFVRRGDDGGQ